MWRFVPSWLTTPERDQGPSGSNDDAPMLPNEPGEPVVSGHAVQAPWEQPADVQEQPSSMAEQLSILTQMVSNLMQELRREDYESVDDGEPQPDQPDFRRESYGNPPAMQPLDAGEESHTSVPVTSQPDGQPTILFRDSQANLEETEVVGTDVLPSSTSIVARFLEPPPSVTESAVLENLRACQTVATTTTTLTWSCSTGMTTSINSLVTSASHTSPGGHNLSTTVTRSVPAEVQQNVPSSEELSNEEGGLALPDAMTSRTRPARRDDGETRGNKPGSYRVWFEDESWRTLDDHRNQGFSQGSSVQPPPRQYRDRSDQQGSCGDWSSAEPYHQTEQEIENSPYRYQANTASLNRETSPRPSASYLERETLPHRYQANTARLGRETSQRPSAPYLERETSPHWYQANTARLGRETSQRPSASYLERETSPYRYQANTASLNRETSVHLLTPYQEREASPYRYHSNTTSLYRGTSHPQELSRPHQERDPSSYWSQDNHASVHRGTSHPQELSRPSQERETSSSRYEDSYASPSRGTSHPHELSRPPLERETSSYRSRPSQERETSSYRSRPSQERETSSSRYEDNYASPSRGISHPHELSRPLLERETSSYRSRPSQERETSSYRSRPSQERETSSSRYEDNYASPSRGISHSHELSRPPLERETSSYRSRPSQERETSSYRSRPSQERETSSYRSRPSMERETSSYRSRPSQERETSSYRSRPSQERETSSYRSRPSQERETSSSRYEDSYASPSRGTSHPHELSRPPLERETSSYRFRPSQERETSSCRSRPSQERETSSYWYEDNYASLRRGTPHPGLSRVPLEQETAPYQYHGNQNVDSTFGSSIAESNPHRPGLCRVCRKSRHWGSVCPEKYTRPCRNCGTFGHWKRECPEPRHNFVNNNPGSNLNFE